MNENIYKFFKDFLKVLKSRFYSEVFKTSGSILSTNSLKILYMRFITIELRDDGSYESLKDFIDPIIEIGKSLKNKVSRKNIMFEMLNEYLKNFEYIESKSDDFDISDCKNFFSVRGKNLTFNEKFCDYHNLDLIFTFRDVILRHPEISNNHDPETGFRYAVAYLKDNTAKVVDGKSDFIAEADAKHHKALQRFEDDLLNGRLTQVKYYDLEDSDLEDQNLDDLVK